MKRLFVSIGLLALLMFNVNGQNDTLKHEKKIKDKWGLAIGSSLITFPYNKNSFFFGKDNHILNMGGMLNNDFQSRYLPVIEITIFKYHSFGGTYSYTTRSDDHMLVNIYYYYRSNYNFLKYIFKKEHLLTPFVNLQYMFNYKKYTQHPFSYIPSYSEKRYDLLYVNLLQTVLGVKLNKPLGFSFGVNINLLAYSLEFQKKHILNGTIVEDESTKYKDFFTIADFVKHNYGLNNIFLYFSYYF
jgi:hypothetical protein